jgi:antiviral helicase SKI2
MSLINMLEQKQLLPVVIFTFSRKRCDDNIYLLSNLDLNTAAEKSRIHVLIKGWLSALSPDDQNIPQIVHLTESLQRGVGVHHSGILPIMKEIIELLFQMGLIRVRFMLILLIKISVKNFQLFNRSYLLQRHLPWA